MREQIQMPNWSIERYRITGMLHDSAENLCTSMYAVQKYHFQVWTLWTKQTLIKTPRKNSLAVFEEHIENRTYICHVYKKCNQSFSYATFPWDWHELWIWKLHERTENPYSICAIRVRRVTLFVLLDWIDAFMSWTM